MLWELLIFQWMQQRYNFSHKLYTHLCYYGVLSFANLQEHVITGGHGLGLMVNGYDPVIKALSLSLDLDIHLNHRYV